MDDLVRETKWRGAEEHWEDIKVLILNNTPAVPVSFQD